MTTPRTALAVLLAAIMLPMLLAGCDSEPTTVIDANPTQGTEQADAMTALDRGKMRREILEDAEAGRQAWLSGDREAFTEYFGPEPQEQMFVRWDAADEDGYVIEREHDVIMLDVTDLSTDGHQAIVSYTFTDRTVVYDDQGNVAFPASGIEADFQLTLQPDPEDPDRWVVVRMIGTKEAAQ